MTDGLAARLLAAIEETEKIARAAVQGNWTVRNHYEVYTDTQVPDDCIVAIGDSGGGAVTAATAEHIARQDPHATLISCEADKRTVQRHAAHSTFERHGLEDVEVCDYCSHDPSGWGPWREWPCPDLVDRADAYGGG